MTDLQELFSRDPLLLSQQDVGLIVTEMRKARGQFSMGNIKAGNTKPKTEKQKKMAELSSSLNLSIDL